jgi:hypothetical protein
MSNAIIFTHSRFGLFCFGLTCMVVGRAVLP